MGSLPREEKMAAAAALFTKSKDRNTVTTKATQHFCLQS
jgi:hypothetical protein